MPCIYSISIVLMVNFHGSLAFTTSATDLSISLLNDACLSWIYRERSIKWKPLWHLISVLQLTRAWDDIRQSYIARHAYWAANPMLLHLRWSGYTTSMAMKLPLTMNSRLSARSWQERDDPSGKWWHRKMEYQGLAWGFFSRAGPADVVNARKCGRAAGKFPSFSSRRIRSKKYHTHRRKAESYTSHI